MGQMHVRLSPDNADGVVKLASQEQRSAAFTVNEIIAEALRENAAILRRGDRMPKTSKVQSKRKK